MTTPRAVKSEASGSPRLLASQPYTVIRPEPDELDAIQEARRVAVAFGRRVVGVESTRHRGWAVVLLVEPAYREDPEAAVVDELVGKGFSPEDRAFCERIGEHPGQTCEEYDAKHRVETRELELSESEQRLMDGNR